MPLLNGLDAARQLQKTHPSIRVIFLTMHSDIGFATEAFRAGASGYLLKHSAAEELPFTIRQALAGRSYITPLIANEVVSALLQQTADPKAAEPQLTPRQREVLPMVAEGRTIKEMATILSVSPRTVEFHKTNLVKALGLSTTAELTQYAVRHGLVAPVTYRIPCPRPAVIFTQTQGFSEFPQPARRC